MPRGVIQPTFAGGELTPNLHARIDIEKYYTAAATMRNFLVLKSGGASNRPGTQFYCPVQDHTKRSRLIEFEFNTEQTYILVLGDQKMWFVKSEGLILETGVAITGATQANPCVITAATHGLTTGDTVFLDGLGGMTELNNAYYRVNVLTADTYELQDEDGVNVDATGFTAYTSGGLSSRVYEIATPWLEADLERLKFEQSADVITFTHPDYDPHEVTRTSDTSWTLTTITFAATIATPANLVASGTGGGDYVVSAVNSSGEESLPSAADEGGVATTLTWDQVADAEFYRVYRDTNTSGSFGFIGIADQAASPTFTTTGGGIEPDYTDGPQLARDYFTGADNRPSTTTFYQERRLFGNTNNLPTTFWGSVSGSFDNFNEAQPVKADDSFQFTLASRKVNEIRHFVPMKELVILTAGAEWVVRGQGDGNVITPTQPPNAQPQSYNGASHVRPLIVNSTVLYVQDRGSIVRDLGYRLDTDAYQGDDLTVLSEHLFRDRRIVEWAYAKTPESIIYCVRDDGELLTLTYLREHDVFAWTHHDTGAGDLFESVASIPEGPEDRVYVIVKRTINGKTRRYVERFARRVITDVRDSVFVDSSLTYDNPLDISSITNANPGVLTLASGHGISDGDVVHIEDATGLTELNGGRYYAANVTATTLTLTDFASPAVDIDTSSYGTYTGSGVLRLAVNSVSNLNHLEGRTVSVLGDGNVLTQQTVTDGAVTLSSSSAVVQVGLPYESDIETLPLEVAVQNSATAFGRRRNVTNVTLVFESSRGGYIGPNVDSLNEMLQRQAEPWGEPVSLITGEYKTTVQPTWDRGKLFFRQSDPLPFTLLAIVPEVEVGGY